MTESEIFSVSFPGDDEEEVFDSIVNDEVRCPRFWPIGHFNNEKGKNFVLTYMFYL